MTNTSIYQDIATRTDGDIYIGVVGPVRTGKSTFIKRFMETLVIPHIDNAFVRERARDELPQSGSGRTIMTAEPKFVPEEAVTVAVEGGAEVSVRLIDCVGYMVDGAIGEYEDGAARMVTTPWFEEEITMKQAAEEGTRKVIAEHSTIGVIVTTDGTVGDLPRESYEKAEERVITEMQALGKPFTVLLNTADPAGEEARALAAAIAARYGVSCTAVNCLTLGEAEIAALLKDVLYEFPLGSFGVFLPPWVDALPLEHAIKSGLFAAIRQNAQPVARIRDMEAFAAAMRESEAVSAARIRDTDLGRGVVTVEIGLPRELFFETISGESGFAIADDGDLMALLTELSGVKKDYDRVAEALRDVREKGYGVVMPAGDELVLQEPEIVKRGGKYGVRLKASAPSIHMIMANIETEVSPAVGGERASEDIINFLLQEFEGDTGRIWESNLFGKSMHDIASEGLQAKIKKMPEEAQEKLRNMLQRIVNEGAGGVICIIL